ncbi:MAG TPA: DUF4184 family protein [Steroidobacteraceae bacterium]|nr:DUF4184 family protein [Steroidobacteraceae bacterium]
MPFTVSHAAAVLPLHRWSRRALPLSALMVGSMSPDFGYVFSYEASRALTHSVPGLVIFCWPAGMLVWLFYVAFLEKTTITLLPDRWHTRFVQTEPISAWLLVRASIAIVLGAATHLVWDAFTHRDTVVADFIPALMARTPGMSWLPVYHLLHFLSSVAGLVILGFWLRHLQRQPARSRIRPYRITDRARIRINWLLLAATLLAGFLEWLPYAHSRYDAQLFYLAVGSMSGLFFTWCLVALGMWAGTRRRRRRRDARKFASARAAGDREPPARSARR